MELRLPSLVWLQGLAGPFLSWRTWCTGNFPHSVPLFYGCKSHPLLAGNGRGSRGRSGTRHRGRYHQSKPHLRQAQKNLTLTSVFLMWIPHLQASEMYSWLCYRSDTDNLQACEKRSQANVWDNNPCKCLAVFTAMWSLLSLLLVWLKTEWDSASVVGGERSSIINQNTSY